MNEGKSATLMCERIFSLQKEKVCHFELKADETSGVPLSFVAQSNGSVVHAYFYCDDICCGKNCCEIDPNFLMLIVSLCASLTLCWLFCCVIFLKWRHPLGKSLSSNNDYVEVPLVRTRFRERTAPPRYRTRPARSAENIRMNDDIIE